MKGAPFEVETPVVDDLAATGNGAGRAAGVPPRRFARTDLGNAERLVARHGRDICYAEGLGWFVWDGGRWRRDTFGAVKRCAKETVRSIYGEAAQDPDPEERTKIAKHAWKSESVTRIRAMIDLARSELEIVQLASNFDTNPWLLNVRNGTLDLQTGALRPHAREDLITKLADVAYDRSARAPAFEQFLIDVQPDQSVRDYLQRLVGYWLTGVIREHVLPILYGTGRNGKSVFTGAVQHVFGDYAKTVPTELLMAKSVDAHPTERAVLRGCRLAVASETDQGRALNVALVKSLTGGDKITARFMRMDFFEFLPTHKLSLATNNRPVIRETKDAIWSRVHLIPWLAIFDAKKGKKPDVDMLNKLRAEAAGILRWAVEGCLAWQKQGLAPPDAVLAATGLYRAESDTLGDFLSECCVVDPHARITRASLRNAYEAWSAETGDRYPLGPKQFAEELRTRGFAEVLSMREPGRPSPTRGWQGLRLRSAADDVATYPDVGTNPANPSNTRAEGVNGNEVTTGHYVTTSVDSEAVSATAAAEADSNSSFDVVDI